MTPEHDRDLAIADALAADAAHDAYEVMRARPEYRNLPPHPSTWPSELYDAWDRMCKLEYLAQEHNYDPRA